MVSKKQLNFAIIGSGAIAERGYLPASDLVTDLSITHVVDLDKKRARDLAKHFQVPNFTNDYQTVFGKVDAAIVATPPTSHAPITIDCLNHGLHVLCEKPLAVSVQEARKMIAASQQTQNHLAVGMVRRLSASSQLLKKLLDIRLIGDIQRFEIEEGGQFNWPLRTAHVFQDNISGGVLADTGPHLLDLLLWSLGSQEAHLVSYRDDAVGGVEANAILELSVEHDSRQIPGTIELSFTRVLNNTIRFFGDKGWIEAPSTGGCEIKFYPSGKNEEPIVLSSKGATTRKLPEDLALQLSNFADSIIRDSNTYVGAEQAVKIISLVGECHTSRKLISYPWEVKHLETFFGTENND